MKIMLKKSIYLGKNTTSITLFKLNMIVSSIYIHIRESEWLTKILAVYGGSQTKRFAVLKITPIANETTERARRR